MSTKKKIILAAGICILCMCLGLGSGFIVGKRVQKQANTTELINRLLSELSTAVTKSKDFEEQSEQLETKLTSVQSKFNKYVTVVDQLDEARQKELQQLKSSIDSSVKSLSAGVSSVGECEDIVDKCIQLINSIIEYLQRTTGTTVTPAT